MYEILRRIILFQYMNDEWPMKQYLDGLFVLRLIYNGTYLKIIWKILFAIGYTNTVGKYL